MPVVAAEALAGYITRIFAATGSPTGEACAVADHAVRIVPAAG